MRPTIRLHALLVTIETQNLTKKAQPTLNTTTMQVHANQQADQSVAHAPAPARLMGFCLLHRAMNRLRCAGKQTRGTIAQLTSQAVTAPPSDGSWAPKERTHGVKKAKRTAPKPKYLHIGQLIRRQGNTRQQTRIGQAVAISTVSCTWLSEVGAPNSVAACFTKGAANEGRCFISFRI